MKKPLSLLIAAAAAVSLYSCQSGPKAPAKDSLDLSGRDTTVSPADNFFMYANGTWLKNTTIPASK